MGRADARAASGRRLLAIAQAGLGQLQRLQQLAASPRRRPRRRRAPPLRRSRSVRRATALSWDFDGVGAAPQASADGTAITAQQAARRPQRLVGAAAARGDGVGRRLGAGALACCSSALRRAAAAATAAAAARTTPRRSATRSASCLRSPPSPAASSVPERRRRPRPIRVTAAQRLGLLQVAPPQASGAPPPSDPAAAAAAAAAAARRRADGGDVAGWSTVLRWLRLVTRAPMGCSHRRRRCSRC